MISILILCIFIILTVFMLTDKGRKTKKKIDGPKGLPFIGCVLEFGHENMHLKFMYYAQTFGNIFYVKMLRENVIVLNSERLIKKALADDKYKQLFNDRPEAFYGEHFLIRSQTVGSTPNGSAIFHRTAKKELVQAFHKFGSGTAVFEELFSLEIGNFVKEIEGKNDKQFDIQDIIKNSLSNTVSILFRGEPISESNADLFWDHADGADFYLNANVNAIMMLLPVLRFLPGTYRRQFQGAKKAFDKLTIFFQDIKASYKPGESRGVIHHYLETQKQEVAAGREVFFTDERIVAQMSEFVVGGILPLRSMLTNSILVLLNHPEIQIKIQRELDLHISRERAPTLSDLDKCPFLKAFQTEMERYVNAVPLPLPHYCRENVKFEDYDIDANTTIIANVWYVHHDEKIWGDPWNFRPERFLDEHGQILPSDHILRKSVMTYGYGRRSCPGEVLGRTRNLLYIAAILKQFSLVFPPGESVSCDPRREDVYDMKFTIRAKPFLCCTIGRTKKA